MLNCYLRGAKKLGDFGYFSSVIRESFFLAQLVHLKNFKAKFYLVKMNKNNLFILLTPKKILITSHVSLYTIGHRLLAASQQLFNDRPITFHQVTDDLEIKI